MKVNITLDTNKLSLTEVVKIAAKANCDSRVTCDGCVFYTDEVLRHGDMETSCISNYLASKLNVNKL